MANLGIATHDDAVVGAAEGFPVGFAVGFEVSVGVDAEAAHTSL